MWTTANPPPRRPLRPLPLVGLAIVLAGLVLGIWALLTGRDRPDGPAPTRPAETGRAPLTGLPAAAADLARPAVTVKVSNTPDARPPRGLGDADIVFVEPITRSTTRLVAIFHSRLPDEAGPVGSLRPADAPLIGPTRGIIASTMAVGWVLEYVAREAELADLGTLRVPRGVYRLDPDRPASDDAFVRPQRLLGLSDRSAPPAPYFRYAASADQSTAQRQGRPAAAVTIHYGTSTARWTYSRQTGQWLRTEAGAPHRIEGGARVAADNVIILHAQRDISVQPSGRRMLIPDLIDASGSLEVFVGGKVVAGRWRKGDVNEPFEFLDLDGRPLLLAPGRTWVECGIEVPVQIR